MIADEWTQPLYEGCKLSKMVAKLLIASFSSYCGLTKDAQQLMLDMFAALLPNDSSLPKTVYLFEKLFPKNKSSVVYSCPGDFFILLIKLSGLAIKIGFRPGGPALEFFSFWY